MQRRKQIDGCMPNLRPSQRIRLPQGWGSQCRQEDKQHLRMGGIRRVNASSIPLQAGQQGMLLQPQYRCRSQMQQHTKPVWLPSQNQAPKGTSQGQAQCARVPGWANSCHEVKPTISLGRITLNFGAGRGGPFNHIGERCDSINNNRLLTYCKDQPKVGLSTLKLLYSCNFVRELRFPIERSRSPHTFRDFR